VDRLLHFDRRRGTAVALELTQQFLDALLDVGSGVIGNGGSHGNVIVGLISRFVYAAFGHRFGIISTWLLQLN
jgi:hypothetical protein